MGGPEALVGYVHVFIKPPRNHPRGLLMGGPEALVGYVHVFIKPPRNHP